MLTPLIHGVATMCLAAADMVCNPPNLYVCYIIVSSLQTYMDAMQFVSSVSIHFTYKTQSEFSEWSLT
jgi:hypothetical protein